MRAGHPIGRMLRSIATDTGHETKEMSACTYSHSLLYIIRKHNNAKSTRKWVRLILVMLCPVPFSSGKREFATSSERWRTVI